jgi:hypothetical protein
MRRIGCRRLNVITSTSKQTDNVIASTKFTAEIETNITIRGRSREAVKCEPSIEKINRWGFRSKTPTEKHTTEVIDQYAVTSLAMNATKSLDTVGIGRRVLDDKAKIDGDTLVALSSSTGRRLTASSFK